MAVQTDCDPLLLQPDGFESLPLRLVARVPQHLAVAECPGGEHPRLGSHGAAAPHPRHPNDRDHIVTRIDNSSGST